MGTMKHHAIAVTDVEAERIRQAHGRALSLFSDNQVSSILKSRCGGYLSFFVAPDGSKEGWTGSNSGDAERDMFITWLQKHSCPYSWAEIQYAADCEPSRVTRDDKGVYPGTDTAAYVLPSGSFDVSDLPFAIEPGTVTAVMYGVSEKERRALNKILDAVEWTVEKPSVLEAIREFKKIRGGNGRL